jgi:hypothetical protein
MPSSSAKLDQALSDLIEAFTELEIELDGKFGEDEDTYSSALIETLEAAIENALDEQDSNTTVVATLLSTLTEALEELDPSAFDEIEEESDYDLDDVNLEDYDEEDDDIDLDE